MESTAITFKRTHTLPQMTALLSGAVLLICLWTGTFGISVSAQQNPGPPLTNAAVMKLVRAGFKEKTVIAIIHSRAVRFDLSPERLIELKRSGVSERIILAMIGQDDSEFMSDDFGFEDSRAGKSGDNKRSSRDEGTGIFGSSGGSRSQSNGRGGNEGSTETTGNATVRILRPPVEQGGMPKLEKTPTLTNESIVQMVEAGFSEGTIIRRIEQSPAEFTLSSTEISELRKRRVSQGVIAAMKAAMSDVPASSSPANATNPEN